MSFASLVFFLFLPLVFGLHWLIRSKRWQNCVLLAASYVFYGWWDWRFCGLMVGSSIIDYLGGLWIQQSSDQRARKRILVATLTLNLLILGFFKYANFFSDSLVIALSGVGIEVSTLTLNIILPVGISFYTFQTMSYTLDIYWKRFEARRNLIDYLTFVSFFPQLVAGPIERAACLLPQFETARIFNDQNARAGCRLILWGLAKKLLVADHLAPVVEAAYSNPAAASSAGLVFATICFAFQIYCDFSGYSDIAVGTAKLFNIELMRNFNFPYFATSITDFWRRWHISLSSWFRDYVYVPLGGNRRGHVMTLRNLFIVALISGLWHGAAWTFVVWGALHGVCLIIERAWAVKKSASGNSLPSGIELVARRVLTFSLVCVGWAFFRAENVADGGYVVGRILTAPFEAAFYAELAPLLGTNAHPAAAILVFVLCELAVSKGWNQIRFARIPVVVRWIVYSAAGWALLLFGASRTPEFIYFRF